MLSLSHLLKSSLSQLLENSRLRLLERSDLDLLARPDLDLLARPDLPAPACFLPHQAVAPSLKMALRDPDPDLKMRLSDLDLWPERKVNNDDLNFVIWSDPPSPAWDDAITPLPSYRKALGEWEERHGMTLSEWEVRRQALDEPEPVNQPKPATQLEPDEKFAAQVRHTWSSNSPYANILSLQFISSRGNEYFCEIDEDYLTDRFNLTGLNTEVQYYQYALDLITDVFDLDCDDDMRETIEKSARHLYGLIHARYIVTTRGLAKMVRSMSSLSKDRS